MPSSSPDEPQNVRFWPALDILLLKEVISKRPNDSKSWESVAKSVNEVLQIIRPNSQVSVRACRSRKQDLLQKFKKDELSSLRASGTDEEYGEREQLLTEICSFEIEEKGKASALEKKKQEQGEDVKRLAMQTLTGTKRTSMETEEDDIVTPTKQRKSHLSTPTADYITFLREKHSEESKLKWEQLELDKKKFELEKEEREARLQKDRQMMELLIRLSQNIKSDILHK
ncbi:hypothetical protein SNE40_008685 [Patella caerulea]|uniref:Uncharacterized protein n=1 Tax=Patella caerulea TaxID=87958 RepID=A0AAN8JSD9_PATCE